MTRYDVVPSVAYGVFDRAASEAGRLGEHGREVSSALGSAAGGCGSSIVAEALGAFAESTGSQFQSLAGRSGAAVAGGRRAVGAYVEGDAEMAGNAAKAAAGAPDPQPPGGGGRPGAAGPAGTPVSAERLERLERLAAGGRSG